MKPPPINDYSFDLFEFAKDLSGHHTLFYKILELGNPIYSDAVKTAGVSYNSKNGSIDFLLAKDWFESLNRSSQLFTLSHEAMHILFEHPRRTLELKLDPDLSNIAQDIVINELLVAEYGFNKAGLNFSFTPCFIDTVFKPEEIARFKINNNMTFIDYYNILKELQPEMPPGRMDSLSTLDAHSSDQPPESTSGSSAGNQPEQTPDPEGGQSADNNDLEGDSNDSKNSQDNKGQDDHGGLDTDYEVDGLDNIKTKKNKSQSESRLGTDNIPEEILKDLIASCQHSLTKEESASTDKIMESLVGRQAGSGFGSWLDVSISDVPENTTWQDLVKKQIASFIKRAETEIDSFARQKRNFSMLDRKFMIPGSDYEEKPKPEKYNLYFYLDVSGSCLSYKDEFFTLAKTIPTKYFNLRLFSFDDRVKELDINKPVVYGGGGTSFDIIEENIQEYKNSNNPQYKKYPDAVFVLTDGAGNYVSPEKPKNWTWLLTDNYKRYIPTDSKTIQLNEFKQKMKFKM